MTAWPHGPEQDFHCVELEILIRATSRSLSLRFQIAPASAKNTFEGILSPGSKDRGSIWLALKERRGCFVVLKNTGGVKEKPSA